MSHKLPDRPQLRPHLDLRIEDEDNFVLFDPRRVGKSVVLSPVAFELARRFDGTSTLSEVLDAFREAMPGVRVSLDALARLATGLDEALLLNSARLQSVFDAPIRKPSCIGCYSEDPKEIAQQIDHLFTAPGGPGLPQPLARKKRKLRAVLLPHMDYGRGNITYGFGFKELIENTAARLFVIIGTSHYSPHRFCLTRQHFETPLGVVETDQEYVNQLESAYGDGLFDDPAAHVPEHAIELEVVPLQHLMKKRSFRIVPLLVGSFRDRVLKKADPGASEDIRRIVGALRQAEAACAEEVCYLISGDLAHIGPKFGDRKKAKEPWLSSSRARDAEILKSLESADPATYFQTIAEERDTRRICGLSPTWLTLMAAQPRSGSVLHYQQYIDPAGHESVSFAAAAFYS